MSIKKISDATKLEALNENDTLLVNRNGVLAQISGSEVGGKAAKPALYYIDQTDRGFLKKGTPPNGEYVTLDEAIEALYGAGLYYWTYSAGNPTPESYIASQIGNPFDRCISFKISSGNVSAGPSYMLGVISGATPSEMVSKTEAYFA